MPVFLNTLGNATLGIGICDRCSFKFPLGELSDDGNTRGLKVCKDCKDVYDPWRLPALMDDRVNLPFTRPDVDIALPVVDEEQGPFRVDDEDDFRTTQGDDYRTVEDDN